MAWATRFLTAVAFLAVGVVFAPDLFRSGPASPAAAVTVAKLAHLLCFATCWGAALWVTFSIFRDVPSSEKPALFVKKMAMCCVVFDFVDYPTKNLREKEVKRQTLLELVDHVATATAKFSEAAMQEATRMVAANLFRTFPSSSFGSTRGLPEAFDAEEEEPAWPHLQVVYEFLLRFVASPPSPCIPFSQSPLNCPSKAPDSSSSTFDP